jgi:hypothetical protein
MKHGLMRGFGFVAVALLAISAGLATADAVGPYYAPLSFAAGWAQAAQPQVTVNSKIVIPVENFAQSTGQQDSPSVKGGVSIRSTSGQLSQLLRGAVSTSSLLPGIPIKGQLSSGGSGQKTVSSNTQVNDPALDYIATFTSPPLPHPVPPFEVAIESETSIVSMGQDIVVGYNNLAGIEIAFFPGFGFAYTQLMVSGYSVSHDGGKTWRSGFIPPVSPDAPITGGDPGLTADRNGNIFYGSSGFDAIGLHFAITISKSTDMGDTFAPGVIAAVDDGLDKPWIASGPDPNTPSRDNIYVTWTSFKAASSELWLSRSIDGGATWTTKQLFAPVDDGINTAFIQFSNPVVDATTGRLYVPFLHFSYLDSDNVRVLVSDDGGETFHLLAFNIAGAVDTFAFPNVIPGAVNDCGVFGGFRNVLHQGPAIAGRFGLSRWTQATRLIAQPAAAADRGRLVFAINSSTSPFFGDPSAGSVIRVVLSPDAGASWATPFVIAPSTSDDPQHVLPALALGQNGNRVWVGYYVQQSDERLRTDLATLHINGNQLALDQITPLSNTTFDLTPSDITLASGATDNFARVWVECYDVGEYMSVQARVRGQSSTDDVVAAWGDNRNPWTGPPDSVAPYTHAKPDVFFGAVGN